MNPFEHKDSEKPTRTSIRLPEGYWVAIERLSKAFGCSRKDTWDILTTKYSEGPILREEMMSLVAVSHQCEKTSISIVISRRTFHRIKSIASLYNLRIYEVFSLILSRAMMDLRIWAEAYNAWAGSMDGVQPEELLQQ